MRFELIFNIPHQIVLRVSVSIVLLVDSFQLQFYPTNIVFKSADIFFKHANIFFKHANVSGKSVKPAQKLLIPIHNELFDLI